MYKIKRNDVYASEIAEFINKSLVGKDLLVKTPRSITNPSKDSIIFIRSKEYFQEYFNDIKFPILIICSDNIKIKPNKYFSIIYSKNPRLDFIRVLHEFFVENISKNINNDYFLDKESKVDSDVNIGHYSSIEGKIKIGPNTLIENNITITGDVIIGKDCVIKSNSLIGSEGFGFEYDEKGIPIHFPHIGRIIIRDHTWIGACSTIERPVFDTTIIERNVKIDDIVHIGGNCKIGEKTLIAAGTILSNNVTIGKNCWLAPNVSIKQNVIIGNNVIIGLGSVILKDIPSNSVYAGNPGTKIKDFKKEQYSFGIRL